MTTEKPPEPAPAVPSWRAELDALKTVCEQLEPLDAPSRRRALAAVLCTFDDDAASAALDAWQQKHKGG